MKLTNSDDIEAGQYYIQYYTGLSSGLSSGEISFIKVVNELYDDDDDDDDCLAGLSGINVLSTNQGYKVNTECYYSKRNHAIWYKLSEDEINSLLMDIL